MSAKESLGTQGGWVGAGGGLSRRVWMDGLAVCVCVCSWWEGEARLL